MKSYKVAILSAFTALAVILAVLIHFPIIPQAPFLEYDPADIPIIIITFLFGPSYGLIITIIVSLIQGLTVSASSGFYGILMHIISTGSFCIIAGLIYKRIKGLKGYIIASIIGFLLWQVVTIVANLLVTPLFLNVDRIVVLKMIPAAILPFNLAKIFLNLIIAKPLFFQMLKLIPKLEQNNLNIKKKKNSSENTAENENQISDKNKDNESII